MVVHASVKVSARRLREMAQQARKDIIQPMSFIKTTYVDNEECPTRIRSIMGRLCNFTLSADQARQRLTELEESLNG